MLTMTNLCLVICKGERKNCLGYSKEDILYKLSCVNFKLKKIAFVNNLFKQPQKTWLFAIWLLNVCCFISSLGLDF